MIKFYNFLKNNLIHITICFLLALILSLALIPYIVNIDYIKYHLAHPKIEHLWSILLLLLIVLFLTFKRTVKFIRKYINNFSLESPPITFFDYIILILAFFCFINCFWLQSNFNNVSPLIFKFLYLSLNIALIYGIFCCLYLMRNKSIKSNKRDIDILDDIPIYSISEDLLDRKLFVNIFTKEVTSNSYGKQTKVFNLSGKWGEGKTSVVNLFKEEIINDERFLVVNFNPWHYKDEQAIISAFFYEIESVISNKYVFNDIRTYFKKYIKLISFGFIQIEHKIDIFSENFTFNQTKSKIQSNLDKLNKKVILIIDDIDRLEFEEVMYIFKLVNLIAKFDNFIFVLVFDNSLVQKYLLNHNFDKDYLEKIIHRPIFLPQPERAAIENYLFKEIKKILNSNQYPEEEIEAFEREFNYQFNLKINEQFYTLRNVKVYLKALRFELPVISREINFFDFCIFIIIKVFYPSVYDAIVKYPGNFIILPNSNRYSLENIFGIKESEKFELKKEYLDTLISSEENKELIKYLLSLIFPKIGSYYGVTGTNRDSNDVTSRLEKRISNYESFQKYITLKVSSQMLSDKFIELIIQNWNSQEDKESVILDNIKTLQNTNQLLDLFNKLFIFHQKLSNETILNIIRVVYKNAHILSKKGRDNLWQSEFDRIVGFIFFSLNERFECEEINQIIDEIIENCNNIPFVFNTVYYSKRVNDGTLVNLYECINIEKLINKVNEKASKYYIQEQHNIFEELHNDRDLIFVLFQWATNWGNSIENNFEVVNSYLKPLLKLDFYNILALLLPFYKVNYNTRNQNKTFILDDLSKIIDIDFLKEIAKENVENIQDTELMEMILHFIEKAKTFKKI